MKSIKFIFVVAAMVTCSTSAMAEWVLVSKHVENGKTSNHYVQFHQGIPTADQNVRTVLVSYGGIVNAYQFDCQNQRVRQELPNFSIGTAISKENYLPWGYVSGPGTNERHVFNYVCGIRQK